MDRYIRRGSLCRLLKPEKSEEATVRAWGRTSCAPLSNAGHHSLSASRHSLPSGQQQVFSCLFSMLNYHRCHFSSAELLFSFLACFSIQKVFPYFFSTFILFHLHGFTIKSMSIGFLRKVMIWGINIMCQKYFPFHSMFFPKWNVFNIFDLWSFHSLSWQHRDSGHSLCLSGKNVEPAMALSE